MGEYVYPANQVPDYTSILVPNVDNTRTSYLLDTIAKQHKVILTHLKHLYYIKRIILSSVGMFVTDVFYVLTGCAAYW